MATCSTCAGELKPEWRFCVYCGTAVAPGAVDEAEAPARINPVAILALLLGVVGGIPAIAFGHIALAQIKRSHERGKAIAVVATVLGYLWVVVWTVLLVRWASGLH